MMLSDVSVGCGRADGEGTVLNSVDDTLIEGCEGLIGCTDRERD